MAQATNRLPRTASAPGGDLHAYVARQNIAVEIALPMNANNTVEFLKRARPKLDQDQAASQRFQQASAVGCRRDENDIAEVILDTAQGRLQSR